MSALTAADMLTPGQRQAKERRDREAFIKEKFKIDNNPNPQFFNGTITRGFVMRDGSVYIEFSQFHSKYQIIISELMISTYGYAKKVVELFSTGKQHLITVKGISGRVNDKGIRNVKQVSYIK
tara:strand:+ start:125 stop:493 length:369 start_codon:yes stop_codon:yes gene_type:complete